MCSSFQSSFDIYITMYYSDIGRRKLMSTSLQRKCTGWNKTEFHIRNDNHAFVVKTPCGTSAALLSHRSDRTINLEELSLKLRNWNPFWFATLPNKQMPRSKKGINSFSSTNRFISFYCEAFNVINISRAPRGFALVCWREK